MITLRGVAMVATATFIYLLARLTQVGWLYLLDAMVWGSIILSLILPFLATLSLSARRNVVRSQGKPGSTGPAEGETVRIDLALKNERPWPRYLLSVDYECPLAAPESRSQRFFVPQLDGGSTLDLAASVTCYKRGLHQLGVVTVESRAPFGLFRWRTRLEAPLSVLVYPEVHAMERLPLMEGAQGTAARPRRTPMGHEIVSSRQYFPGDPVRDIHWRNTARLGKPMVKEHEDAQENVLTIVFDSSRDSGPEPDSMVEHCIRVAASVAAHVTSRGGRVRLLTDGLQGGETTWAVLYRELALLEIGHGPGLATLVGSLPGHSPVLALVSEDDSQGLEALARLGARTSNSAVVLLEGFGRDTDAGATADSLRRLAVPVVHGRPGHLVDTLRALERTGWGRRTTLRVPAGQRG